MRKNKERNYLGVFAIGPGIKVPGGAGTHPRTQFRSSAPHHLRTQICLICAHKPFGGLTSTHTGFVALASSLGNTHALNFTLRRPTKGMLRCNGFYSTLNYILRWPTKWTLRCNGSFPLCILPLGGPQKGCCVAMASVYSKFYSRVAHKRNATL